MFTAASSMTQTPYALALCSSIKSAFLISATTALSDVRNAVWTHVAVSTDLLHV